MGSEDLYGRNPGGWHLNTSQPIRVALQCKAPPTGNKAWILVWAYWAEPVAAISASPLCWVTVCWGFTSGWFSLWTGRTGCILTQSSWKCPTSDRRTPRLPARQFSARREDKWLGFLFFFLHLQCSAIKLFWWQLCFKEWEIRLF